MKEYTEIKKGQEYELFNEDILNSLIKNIQKEVNNMFNELKIKGEKPKPCLLGSFAVNNVPLKNGGTTNLWVEYNGFLVNMMGVTAIDCGIHRAIMFDEIPDIILDRYNEVKKIILSGGNF